VIGARTPQHDHGSKGMHKQWPPWNVIDIALREPTRPVLDPIHDAVVYFQSIVLDFLNVCQMRLF